MMVKEKYQIPHAFTDYRDLLAIEELDAVSVCTPNLTHVPISIDALEAGKHVLCEKPVAVTGKEAMAAVQKAQAIKPPNRTRNSRPKNRAVPNGKCPISIRSRKTTRPPAAATSTGSCSR